MIEKIKTFFSRAIGVVALIVALSLTACGGGSGSTAYPIDSVEAALDSGQFSKAQSLLTEFFPSEKLDSLSATELARLSIAYMRLADYTDNPDNCQSTATAGELYGRAIKADSAAAEQYYSAVPVQYSGFVDVMRGLHYGPQQHTDLGCQDYGDELDSIPCNH